MANWWQYPGQASDDPESRGAPADDKLEWFTPFSGPVRVAALASALIASTGMAPIDAETLGDPAADKLEWFAPFSEPVRAIPRHQDEITYFGLQDDAVAADTSTEWFVPFSEPVRFLPGARCLAVHAAGFIPTDLETIGDPGDHSRDAGLVPFSEPVRRLHPDAAAQIASGSPPGDPGTIGDPAKDKLEWFVPFSEPVLPIPRPQLAPAFFEDLEPVAAVDDKSIEWFAPFSGPGLPLGPEYHAALASSTGQAPIDPETLNEPGIPAVAAVVVDKGAGAGKQKREYEPPPWWMDEYWEVPDWVLPKVAPKPRISLPPEKQARKAPTKTWLTKAVVEIKRENDALQQTVRFTAENIRRLDSRVVILDRAAKAARIASDRRKVRAGINSHILEMRQTVVEAEEAYRVKKARLLRDDEEFLELMKYLI